MRMNKGFSLVEMLVVVTVFTVVIVVATQALLISLKNSRKSNAVGNVNESLNYSIDVIQRVLRNAKSVDCVNSDSMHVLFTSEYGTASSFACTYDGASNNWYIASTSGAVTVALTSASKINIVNCSPPSVFTETCPAVGVSGTPEVDILLIGKDITTSGGEGSIVNQSTRVFLRNYNQF